MLSEVELLEALSTTYRFSIPPFFAKFLDCTLHLRQKPDYQNILDERDFLAFLIGGMASKTLFQSSDSGRYFHTPPELFPFGGCGSDGIHYGFVVHAPELALSDYAVGEFDPMDDTGVTLIGNTTQEALECLLSEALEICDDLGKRSLLTELAQVLDLHPTPEKIRQNYTTPIQPHIPSGWYFEPSGDGVGVLAPSSFWSPNTLTIETWDFETIDEHSREVEDVDRALEEVQRAFYEEYPATALFILRELYWRSPGLELLELIAPWWQRAYEELNRSCLAEVVQEHLTEQQTLQAEWKQQEIEYYTSTVLWGGTIEGNEFAEFKISDKASEEMGDRDR